MRIKKINKIYLPDSIRVFDSATTVDLDVLTQSTRDDVLFDPRTKTNYLARFPYYEIKTTDYLVKITAESFDAPYDYAELGTGSSKYNSDTAFPDGDEAVYNRRIFKIILPLAIDKANADLWLYCDHLFANGDKGWDIVIETQDGETLHGADGLHLLSNSGQAVQLLSDGIGWYVISDRHTFNKCIQGEAEWDLTFMGINAGKNWSDDGTQYDLTFIGTNAGADNTGTSNTFVGEDCGESNEGSNCCGIGEDSLRRNTGNFVNAMGRDSGWLNTGSHTVLMGRAVGRNNEGSYTIGIGHQAVTNNKGEYTIGIGRNMGKINTVDGMLFIGNTASSPADEAEGISDALIIGQTIGSKYLQINGEAKLDNYLSMGGSDESLATKKYVDDSTGASGTINGGANIGTGVNVFKNKSGSNLNFRTLVAGTGITLTQSTNEILVEGSGGTAFSYGVTQVGHPFTGSSAGEVYGAYINTSGEYALATNDDDAKIARYLITSISGDTFIATSLGRVAIDDATFYGVMDLGYYYYIGADGKSFVRDDVPIADGKVKTILFQVIAKLGSTTTLDIVSWRSNTTAQEA